MFICAICFTLACITNARAQDIIASSACYFKTSFLSVSWTIGEIATETFANEDIILTQGFNQANITITDITEDLFTDINIIVYPNPVKDVFTIETGSDNKTHLKAELYNLKKDSKQEKNVIGDYPDIARQLHQNFLNVLVSSKTDPEFLEPRKEITL